jgi:hypothetical protein
MPDIQSADQDVEGHGYTWNVNETIVEDEQDVEGEGEQDVEGHGYTWNVNETIVEDEQDVEGEPTSTEGG